MFFRRSDGVGHSMLMEGPPRGTIGPSGSYRHRFLEDLVFDLRLEGLASDQVDLCPEELAQVHLELDVFEKIDGLAEIDQDIDIGMLGLFSFREGTEDLEGAHLVAFAKVLHVLSELFPDDVQGQHGIIFPILRFNRRVWVFILFSRGPVILSDALGVYVPFVHTISVWVLEGYIP